MVRKGRRCDASPNAQRPVELVVFRGDTRSIRHRQELSGLGISARRAPCPDNPPAIWQRLGAILGSVPTPELVLSALASRVSNRLGSADQGGSDRHVRPI